VIGVGWVRGRQCLQSRFGRVTELRLFDQKWCDRFTVSYGSKWLGEMDLLPCWRSLKV